MTASAKAKRNYKYGKLEDGELKYAPYYLVIGKKTYVNASTAKYLSQGWKVIEEGEVPDITEEEAEEGWYVVTHYTENETTVYIIYSKEKSEETSISE